MTVSKQRKKNPSSIESEFMSQVSHRLRTPLSIASWYTEMLLKGEAGRLTSLQRKYVREIAGSNERMVKIVNTLLTVAQIETGRIDPVINRVDVRQALGQAMADERSVARARKARIAMPSGATPPIAGDLNLLRIVFRHLLGNAIRYSPVGSRTRVTCTVRRDDVHISVTDAGYGITASERRLLFTKNFRGTSGKENYVDGLGLGLYVVRALVRAQRGSIQYRPLSSGGSEFTVILPVYRAGKRRGG